MGQNLAIFYPTLGPTSDFVSTVIVNHVNHVIHFSLLGIHPIPVPHVKQ